MQIALALQVIGGRQKWRPEPMSVSRMQSEQPLVHYASATFWDWPEQKRRSHSAFRLPLRLSRTRR